MNIPRYTVSGERHDDALDASWWTIVRRLPRLSTIAIRLAWQAAPYAVLLTCFLQLVSGAVTAVGLYATTNALTPLLAAGPTGEWVREALPALVIVTFAACARAVVAALTVATTARIGPRVDGIAEARYLEATTRAPLACYSDHRAPRRRIVRDLIGLFLIGTGAAGLLGAISVTSPLVALFLAGCGLSIGGGCRSRCCGRGAGCAQAGPGCRQVEAVGIRATRRR